MIKLSILLKYNKIKIKLKKMKLKHEFNLLNGWDCANIINFFTIKSFENV